MVGGLIYSLRNSSNKQSVFWPNADFFLLLHLAGMSVSCFKYPDPVCSVAAALVPWLPAHWLVKSLMNLRFSLSGPHSALGWTCSGWVASEVCHKCILCPGCLLKSCNTAPGSVNFMQMKHNTSSSSNPFSQFIQILHQLYVLLSSTNSCKMALLLPV